MPSRRSISKSIIFITEVVMFLLFTIYAIKRVSLVLFQLQSNIRLVANDVLSSIFDYRTTSGMENMAEIKYSLC